MPIRYQGKDLGDWEPEKLSRLGFPRPLVQVALGCYEKKGKFPEVNLDVEDNSDLISVLRFLYRLAIHPLLAEAALVTMSSRLATTLRACLGTEEPVWSELEGLSPREQEIMRKMMKVHLPLNASTEERKAFVEANLPLVRALLE